MYNPRGRGKQIGCGYCKYEKTCELNADRLLAVNTNHLLYKECGEFLHFKKLIK